MTHRIPAFAMSRLDGSDGDGVHVMWAPPPGVGHSIGGWDVRRRDATGRSELRCTSITPAQLDLLHRVLRLRTTVADLALRQVPCPGSNDDAPAAVTTIGTAPQPRCVAYDITLPTGHRIVQVRIDVPGVLAVGMRAGKAVATRVAAEPSGSQVVRLEDLDVDQVVLYVAAAAKSLEICLDDQLGDDDADWENEHFVVSGLQVPIRTLDPTLASDADELDRARSRLLRGETIGADAFATVAGMMNAAADGDDHTGPVWTTTVTREEPDDPFLEVRTWPYALSLLVDSAWRRALGFSVLDRATGLVSGNRYDYRVTGRFRRRDLDERVHGFHAVPRGATLPTSFALGAVSLLTPAPAIVEQRPEPSGGVLDLTGRKGIALDGDPCLTLSFPVPVPHVVLELQPGSSLSWTASATDFLPGLPIQSFGQPLPPDRRVRIDPPEPVDTIVLSGRGFLFAVREVTAGVDPDEVVEISTVVHGVRFEDSLRPKAPLSVDTDNLQRPALPADPAARPPEPPGPLGFRVGWDPAPPPGSPPAPWPADLAAAPPIEALAFRIERRRVDTAEPFEALDEVVFGSRGARVDPPAVGPGADLEAVFADGAPPTPPVSTTMTVDDVLVDGHHNGPPPGSTHQYRVSAVDAIGRSSASDTVGAVVRLEKHRSPPQPVGPPRGVGSVEPSGVRARVLQAADAELAPEDVALLGPSADAVVIEWGWTERERDADPHATEFRVYWEPTPPDEIAGTVTGTPTLVNGRFEMAATLDRPVAVDALAGRYIPLPDHPFRVEGHGAGQSVTLRIEPSVLDPLLTPGPGPILARPMLDGAEQRPTAWAERTAVVPMTAADTYRHVLRNRLVLDADHPRTRVWVGVSASDDQGYVDDELPAAAPNGGRPGNESAVVVASVTARYLGRPDFTVPPPLPDVPELVTDEPAGDTVDVLVDLPSLLPAVPVPAGHLVQLERLRLDRVVSSMSALSDDTIGADLPDGTSTSYSLANPSDHADLLAEIRTGTPARVEGRFLMDFVLRFDGDLEPWWEAVLAKPIALGALTDRLPAKADRHLHRIRLVDPAGHVSAGAAIPAQIVRVPSLRSPRPPELSATGDGTGSVDVHVRVRDAFDLAHVVVFAVVEDAGDPPGGAQRGGAQLLRVPDLRDRYPDDGFRLRLVDGILLAPAVVIEATGGTVAPPDRLLTATLTPGHDQRVALWAVTLTRDGIPSRPSGPAVALTGPAPLVAPTPAVSRVDGTDTAQWTPVTALLAFERTTDAGATWQRVTPWLPAGTSEQTLPVTGGDVLYRTIVRGPGGSRSVGAEVTPS